MIIVAAPVGWGCFCFMWEFYQNGWRNMVKWRGEILYNKRFNVVKNLQFCNGINIAKIPDKELQPDF